MESHKSLSWRHLLIFNPLENGQVLTSALRRLGGDHHVFVPRQTLRLTDEQPTHQNLPELALIEGNQQVAYR
jgi:hypothetical protein